jgi:homoaconitate hydratase
VKVRHNIPQSDADAFYAKELTIDLSTVEPFVSGPNTVKTYAAVSELKEKNITINKAYLVSCVNSRVDDIAEAAAVVKGKKISEKVKFYIAAASSEVQKEAERYGYWQSLIEAGAIPLPPGCGPVLDLELVCSKMVKLESATNRNF